MAWNIQIRNMALGNRIDVCSAIQAVLPGVVFSEKQPLDFPAAVIEHSPQLATSRLANFSTVDGEYQADHLNIATSFFLLKDDKVDEIRLRIDGIGNPTGILSALYLQLHGKYIDTTLDRPIDDAAYFSKTWPTITHGFVIHARGCTPLPIPTDSQIAGLISDLKLGAEIIVEPLLACLRDSYLHFEYANCLQNESDYWFCRLRVKTGTLKYFICAKNSHVHPIVICTTGIEGADSPELFSSDVLHSFNDTKSFLAYCQWFMAGQQSNVFKFSDGSWRRDA